VEINLEELPISDAVVTQELVVAIQNCSGLGIILGVKKGEGLILDRDPGYRLQFVLQRGQSGG